MEIRYTASLDDGELLRLDGLCSPETQAIVDRVRRRREIEGTHGLSPREADFAWAVLNEAAKSKRLIYRTCNIRRCCVCGRNDGYCKVARTTKYKRRGQDDFDRPILFRGVEFADRFIIWEGSPYTGACTACVERVTPALRVELANVEAELPATLMGSPTAYRRFDIRKCLKCGWVGGEDEMGWLPTLMGDGRYAGKCPQCGNESRPFGGRAFETKSGEYAVRRVDSLRPEVKMSAVR